MVEVIGALTLAFVAVLVFGLLTGRISWRQQGCCAPPAERDLRLREPAAPPADPRDH